MITTSRAFAPIVYNYVREEYQNLVVVLFKDRDGMFVIGADALPFIHTREDYGYSWHDTARVSEEDLGVFGNLPVVRVKIE